MDNLPALRAPDLGVEIDGLAYAAARANGPLLRLVNRLGGGIEAQLGKLPVKLRGDLERLTARALKAGAWDRVRGAVTKATGIAPGS